MESPILICERGCDLRDSAVNVRPAFKKIACGVVLKKHLDAIAHLALPYRLSRVLRRLLLRYFLHVAMWAAAC